MKEKLRNKEKDEKYLLIFIQNIHIWTQPSYCFPQMGANCKRVSVTALYSSASFLQAVISGLKYTMNFKRPKPFLCNSFNTPIDSLSFFGLKFKMSNWHMIGIGQDGVGAAEKMILNSGTMRFSAFNC